MTEVPTWLPGETTTTTRPPSGENRAKPVPQPPTPAPAPGATPTPVRHEATADEINAFDYIRSILEDYGLADLADWAWDQIVGGSSASQVALDMHNQPAFQQRFPAIEERKRRGLPAISPAEYVAYERAALQMFRNAGLPPDFYDSPQDVARLITEDVSVAELSQRISDEGFGRVARAPQAVRDAFTEFFGVQGDAALAAFFLDPDRAQPALERMATQADIAGRARGLGLALTQQRAFGLAELGVTGLQAQQAAAQLAERRALFVETVGEEVDLTAEQEGLNLTLGIGPGGEQIERRIAERTAAFAGGGGAAAGQRGIAGLGLDVPEQ